MTIHKDFHKTQITSLAKIELSELVKLWKDSEEQIKTENTPELRMVRAWIMDAIESKVSPELFEKYLDTENVEILLYVA